MVKEEESVCLFLSWMNTRIGSESFYNTEVFFLQPSHTHTWLYLSYRSELLLGKFLAIWGDCLAVLGTYVKKTEFPIPHSTWYCLSFLFSLWYQVVFTCDGHPSVDNITIISLLNKIPLF